MIMFETSDTGNLFSDSHWVPSVHVDNTPGLAIKAYIASDPAPTARIVGEQLSTWPYAPSMTDFSSRGPDPVALDIIKPDVTAPGLQILAGNSPTPDAGTLPGELFQAIAGTSMSSPHVAGIFALLKQEHPELERGRGEIRPDDHRLPGGARKRPPDSRQSLLHGRRACRSRWQAEQEFALRARPGL